MCKYLLATGVRLAQKIFGENTTRIMGVSKEARVKGHKGVGNVVFIDCFFGCFMISHCELDNLDNNHHPLG